MRSLAGIWPRLALWVPPVVLGGVGLFEIWVEPIFAPPPSFPGPMWVHTLGVIVIVGGLLVRRRAPGIALAAVLADVLLEWAYGPDVISTTAFVAMLVAFFSVGAHCDLRSAALWFGRRSARAAGA